MKCVEQRFYAKAVTDKQQFLLPFIPDRKSKNAVQPLKKFLSIAAIAV